ncbi:MAG: hypothetical protein K6G28_02240 [Acholeplasmatales bacterium]|nr:hypothetical protein [Acholeplasmatales bacterium]
MTKFKVDKNYFMSLLGQENSNNLHEFFREKKYLNSDNELTIRFFMYYMNYYIELPITLEEKRKDIFKEINKFNFQEEDFMAYKAAFKKAPYGFKYED